VRERERESERECVCVSVCVCERERERESVCACESDRDVHPIPPRMRKQSIEAEGLINFTGYLALKNDPPPLGNHRDLNTDPL